MKQASSLAVLSALLCFGCAAAPEAGRTATTARSVEPAALLPPSAFPYDFQWRQRVTARWPTGEHSFDAVLQRSAGDLLLVGLSPLGLPGFVLRLRPTGAIEVENRSGRDLPFEPRYVLADVERVFFPWLGDAPQAGGERVAQRGDSRIVERYEHGQLMARRFERQTRQGLERVDIAYERTSAGADAPRRAVLENALLGYTLTIETLEQTRLAPPSTQP
jgi:hypothetical protein